MKKLKETRALLSIFLCVFLQNTQAAIWKVGPTRVYTNCYQIANLVQNNDTIQIDFAVYSNVTQVLWKRNNLLIEGVGGRPRLEAGSTIANDMVNGKGIFVISGTNVRVRNLEFANAKVQDHNGAGIRQEGANLHVSHCRFVADEMGILCGNIPNCKTTVEYSEFVNGGSSSNPGYQHNIYINHIDTLLFRYNYSHDAIAEGHEFKSRANYNFILYNRIANEKSIDSRTIDLPNGGTSVIVGNIIEQGENSANTNLLGYGLEGLTNSAPHNLWICSNTFINKKDKGSFIQVATGTDTLFLKNNIFAGAKTAGLIIGSPKILDNTNNFIDDNIVNVNFKDAKNFDYHLTTNSPAKDAGLTINTKIYGYSLTPYAIYKDICDFETRFMEGIIDIGAFEFRKPLSQKEEVLNAVLLYPNPTHDNIFIKNSPFVNEPYLILNQIGNVVKTGSIEANSLDLSTLASGIYFIKIKNSIFKVTKI